MDWCERANALHLFSGFKMFEMLNSAFTHRHDVEPGLLRRLQNFFRLAACVWLDDGQRALEQRRHGGGRLWRGAKILPAPRCG